MIYHKERKGTQRFLKLFLRVSSVRFVVRKNGQSYDKTNGQDYSRF